MKSSFNKLIFILFIGGLVLQNSICQAQIHTVNYSIPDWNASGYFTFQAGTSLNSITGKTEGYIKITTGDGKAIEINSQKIDAIIQALENDPVVKVNENKTKKVNLVEVSKANAINKLKKLKLFLRDNEKMKNLKTSLQKASSVSTLNWDYTLQTIEDIQVQTMGTVD